MELRFPKITMNDANRFWYCEFCRTAPLDEPVLEIDSRTIVCGKCFRNWVATALAHPEFKKLALAGPIETKIKELTTKYVNQAIATVRTELVEHFTREALDSLKEPEREIVVANEK